MHTDDQKRPRFFTLKTVGVAVLLALVLSWVGWYFYAKQQLDKELDRLRAHGEPITIEEWYAKAEANLPDEPTPHADEILGFLYELKDSDFTYSVPGRVNKYFMDYFVGDEEIYYGEWSNDVLEEAEAILAANTELLETIERIASYPPMHPSEAILFHRVQEYHRYPIPDLLAIRAAATLLQLKLMIQLNRGDIGGAISTQETMYQLCRHYENLPRTLINAMIAVALRSIANSSTAEIIKSDLMNAENLVLLFEILDSNPPPELIVEALRFERNSLVSLLTTDIGIDHHTSFTHGLPKKLLKTLFGWIAKPYMDQNVVALIRMFDEHFTLIETNKDRPLKIWTEFNDLNRYSGYNFYIFATIIMPNLMRSGIQDAESQVQYQMLRTFAALKRYKLDHHRYPRALDTLVPEYLDAVPIDPFDGEALRYRKVDDGFVLWCVGEDTKSGGGKTDPQMLRPLYHHKCDIVLHSAS